MNIRFIKSFEALQIIGACSKEEQKVLLADKWGKLIVLQRDVFISKNLYKSIREHCDATIVDSIFGVEIKFKVGDFVIGWWTDDLSYKHKAWRISKMDRNYAYPPNTNNNTDVDNVRLATSREISDSSDHVVDYSKLKTGSIVELNAKYIYTYDHVITAEIVFYKTNCFISHIGWDNSTDSEKYTTVVHNNQFLPFNAKNFDSCILKVIKY